MVRTLDPISSKKNIPIGTTVAMPVISGMWRGGVVSRGGDQSKFRRRARYPESSGVS